MLRCVSVAANAVACSARQYCHLRNPARTPNTSEVRSSYLERVMKKLLLGTVAIITVAGVDYAMAADLPVAPPSPAAYNWTGWYVGVTAGAMWGQYDPRTSTIDGGYIGARGAAGVSAAGTQTIKPSGFVAGVDSGYNWWAGNLLFGAEADLQAINLQGATNSGAVHYLAMACEFTVTSYGNTNWLFTARPRIEFVAPNNWLFYATGGRAIAESW